jgi:NTP pyrophosphatase (non-canonical NTP hydrolase)
MLRKLTIKQAQQEVKEFLEAQGKDWTQIDNHFYDFTHLSEEIGELARDIINADFNLFPSMRKHVSREKTISQIQDDLGDILYHLFKLAIAYDIDLAEAFEKAVTDIKNKYGKKMT